MCYTGGMKKSETDRVRAAAAALGRLGGIARAKSLTPERRSEIARKAQRASEHSRRVQITLVAKDILADIRKAIATPTDPSDKFGIGVWRPAHEAAECAKEFGERGVDEWWRENTGSPWNDRCLAILKKAEKLFRRFAKHPKTVKVWRWKDGGSLRRCSDGSATFAKNFQRCRR
jgi:hypothetical protein